MTAITWSDVLDAAPQLTDAVISTTRQDVLLALAEEKFEPAAFRGADSATYHEIRVLYAAHLGELDRRRGQTSNIQSETVGADSISFTYGAVLSQDSLLESTSYGARILEMIRSSAHARMPVTWGCSW